MKLLSLLTFLFFTASSVIGDESNLVPDPDDTNVLSDVAYLRSQRRRLLREESRNRQDYEFVTGMSKTCQEAESIVKNIQSREAEEIWQPTAKDPYRFPGQMFPLAREQIRRTQLFKIIKRMPKGSLLHGHLKLMVPYDIILKDIYDTPGMIFNASQGDYVEDTQKSPKIGFFFKQNTEGLEYNDHFFPVKEADKYFPGGKHAFEKFIRWKMMILPNEAVHHERGVNQIWKRFNINVDSMGTLLRYEPIVRKFYQHLFKGLVNDGVYWIEFRAGGSVGDLIREGSEEPDPNPNAWWDVMLEEVKRFQKTAKGRNFWGVRVIWGDFRGSNYEKLVHNMGQALTRKTKYKSLFGGYDLVGQEDLGHTLDEVLPELVAFQKKAHEERLEMPFFFHAGETLVDGKLADENLFDALELKSRRIGHAFDIYKHPDLMKALRQKQVLVEVCPISHEVLRLTTDILHHPLPALVANGVPAAISNDDPAVLGQDSSGLSYDFYQVIQAFDSFELGGLGALAQNSVRWSNFEDQTHDEWLRDIHLGENGHGKKAEHLRKWNYQWEEYCQWIVDGEYRLEGDLLRQDL